MGCSEGNKVMGGKEGGVEGFWSNFKAMGFEVYVLNRSSMEGEWANLGYSCIPGVHLTPHFNM